MKKLLPISFILILNFSFLIAQNNIDLNVLPDVSDYIITKSNPSADTIIIGLHGGPTDELYPGDFEFFETISTFSVVEMQQHQHLNPSIMANSNLTLEEAIIHNDTTVALLQKVVNHFNDMDKTVVLIGHSFGAFLLPEYLDDYGIHNIHRIIPMAGRLNMNQKIVDAFATGYYAYFPDGITVEVEQNQAPPQEWASMKLAAGVGYNRFVDSLATLDLSKLMYVYGTLDEPVGALLPEEVDMLENGNATVLAVENGGHDSPFFDPQMIQILDFIRNDQTVGVHNKISDQAKVEIFPTILTSNLTIQSEKSGVLKIVHVNGQEVFQKELSSGTSNFNLNLPTGFYIASFITVDNELKNQKIVVK